MIQVPYCKEHQCKLEHKVSGENSKRPNTAMWWCSELSDNTFTTFEGTEMKSSCGFHGWVGSALFRHYMAEDLPTAPKSTRSDKKRPRDDSVNDEIQVTLEKIKEILNVLLEAMNNMSETQNDHSAILESLLETMCGTNDIRLQETQEFIDN